MTYRSATILAIAGLACCAAAQHRHSDDAHHHRPPTHGKPHATTFDPQRFLTSRNSKVRLPLPEEKDAFFFVVFGDRTGGPADGVEVLADAVAEVNLLEPDLVMTVGDLVQGYNLSPQWLDQAREFKGIMNKLLMPWFPVAGNHDIYWLQRGAKPPGEHEEDFEQHFGPLWYAFSHKNSWFIALFSDEGHPVTGKRSFNDPECQRMSPAQFDWLKQTLRRTRSADHVFVFIHHPRWLERYGDDWNKVHRELAQSGNVSAVFAGHIHRMRYDGKRDGIEYFTAATVGGNQWGKVPETGFLHQYHIVTVRKSGIAVAAVPVGGVFDPRAITGAISEETRQFDDQFEPLLSGRLAFDRSLGCDGTIKVKLNNPIKHAIEVMLAPSSTDSHWSFNPDHSHVYIGPGQTQTLAIRARRIGDGSTTTLAAPKMEIYPEYVGDELRFALPSHELQIPVAMPESIAPAASDSESALVLDGKDDYLRVDLADAPPKAGPFTVECWVKPAKLRQSQALITGLRQSGFRWRLDIGIPQFRLRHKNSEVELRSPERRLELDRWHHLAAVVDGKEVRMYVDGDLVASADWTDKHTPQPLPVLIGASQNGEGPVSDFFAGQLDEIHITAGARYTGKNFEPKRRTRASNKSRLLLHMDGIIGPWIFDHSPSENHATRHGDVLVGP